MTIKAIYLVTLCYTFKYEIYGKEHDVYQFNPKFRSKKHWNKQKQNA